MEAAEESVHLQRAVEDCCRLREQVWSSAGAGGKVKGATVDEGATVDACARRALVLVGPTVANESMSLWLNNQDLRITSTPPRGVEVIRMSCPMYFYTPCTPRPQAEGIRARWG